MNNADIRERVNRGLKKRYAAERRFRMYGFLSICAAVGFLFLVLGSILGNGTAAFKKTYVQLEINFDQQRLGIDELSTPDQIMQADFAGVIKEALKARFPEVKDRRTKRMLYSVVSSGAEFELADRVKTDIAILNTRQKIWLYADDDVDTYFKGNIDRSVDESDRRIKDKQLVWLDSLEAAGEIKQSFNWTFLTAGDSREPEQAGIRGALMGSFYTLMLTLLMSFPIGVAAAIYLEEFAPKNAWTDLIEVNINNLAAVPSIVFGLLGLAVFINFFGLPRSVPLVGSLVLTLMTLPTIIIASRAAIKSVPPSIKEAALGVGASKMQTTLHHVLPQAMPGMLTGAIVGMAQALGETAPLLMIGMVAFIVDVPNGIFDPATVLPVQIFLWADSPERGFAELTSAAVLVLLIFLVTMNLLAVLLRKKFEKRW